MITALQKVYKAVIDSMHILIATGLYPPDIGGPATYTKLLEKELPKRGFEVTVCSFGAFRRFPRIIRHVLYFLDVIKKGKKVDIIYAQDPVSVGLPALCAAWFLKKHFIVKIVGDYAWEQYQQKYKVSGIKYQVSVDEFQKKRYGLLTELRRFVEHFVARRAEKVVVPSVYLKNIVTLWGVSEKKIHVVYNSFKPPQALGSKKVLRGLMQFNGKMVISVGRLVPWKGFATLIDIAPRFIKHFPHSKLIIVGDGPEMKALLNRISKLNLGDRVVCIGSLDHDILMRYIQAADVFVLNTLYEGFSHVLLEAAALGTPIVTTMVGGNLELLQDQKHALLVPYNDKKALEKAVIKLLNDTPFATKLSKEAQKRAHIFSEEKMIEELIKILQ